MRLGSRRTTALVWIGGFGVYWFIAFYPFHWDPPRVVVNQAARLADGSLRFGASSIARSPGAATWLDSAVETGRLRVELEVRAAATEQRGPARILTISRDSGQRNLTVAQQGPDLVLRLRHRESDENGEPALKVPEVFRDLRWRSVTVDVDDGRLRVDVEGVPRIQRHVGADPFRSWDRSFPLALGNELTLNRPWVGEVRRARMTAGDEVTDLLAPGAVEIPTRWTYVPARLRLLPPREWRPPVADLLSNLVLLGPLGWVLAARGHALLFIVAVGAVLSASMEAGQVFVDPRVPSLVDFALNVLGVVLGAVARISYRHHRGPSSASPEVVATDA